MVECMSTPALAYFLSLVDPEVVKPLLNADGAVTAAIQVGRQGIIWAYVEALGLWCLS